MMGKKVVAKRVSKDILELEDSRKDPQKQIENGEYSIVHDDVGHIDNEYIKDLPDTKE